MASLTPGALAKLLSGAGGGESQGRRSTLLQVIEIAPSISASDDATWLSPAGGFFLKLSDSANSAYVSVSDHADAELVRSDAVRLGQFVHVARLDTAAPVPELRGLRPVPRRVRKPCPCIGNPVELVSSEALFRNSEEKRLSFDSSQRRSWDTKNAVVSPLASPKNVSSLKHSNSLGRKSGIASSKKEPKSPSELGESLKKVSLNSKHGSKQKILRETLPSTITELGKKAAHQRGVAFLAAVRSLEEASVADDVIHCMCVFAELCQSSLKSPTEKMLQSFMDFNHRLVKLADSLLNSDPTAHHSIGSSSWVKAALKTNLASFNLFQDRDKEDQKHLYIVLESPKNITNSPQIKNIQRTLSSSSDSRKEDDLPKQKRSRRSKNETASLVQKLLSASRDWFLGYLDGFFGKGTGSKRDESLSDQLKRVEKWLDDLVSNGSSKDEKRVESLRKKLNGFLSDHRASFGK